MSAVNKHLSTFMFESPAFQNAANTVYNFKVTYESLPANSNVNKKYQFKTDFERMQALLGSANRCAVLSNT
jgi:hypothetical protein